jgi:branched-chain amino acid transport system substrate-binding protein
MHPSRLQRYRAPIDLLIAMLFLWSACVHAAAGPVRIGLDAEFGLENSTSAQAVELGLRTAIGEINSAGGVLGGRPLELVVRDHRSMPARGLHNIEEFAAMDDLVAVFGGRFSPVVIAQLPKLQEAKLLLMAVWSSADAVVDNGMTPNYVFRLSLRDSLALPKMLDHAHRRGLDTVGLLLNNTAWGRSSLAAAEKYLAANPQPKLVETAWYYWKDRSLIAQYRKLLDAGAKAVILVANSDEAAILVREVVALPAEQRVPIISHWGITGGEFFKQAGPALQQIDLTVIQTFSFSRADPHMRQRFLRAAARLGVNTVEEIQSPVGVAQAYDMMHILAKAIAQAGSTDRPAVRDALEKLGSHRGLIQNYKPPFTPTRHEALGPDALFMAHYRDDGMLVPLDN